MERLFSTQASANPFKEAWKIPQPSSGEKISQSRVIIASHFLPYTPFISHESASMGISSGPSSSLTGSPASSLMPPPSDRRSSLSDRRSSLSFPPNLSFAQDLMDNPECSEGDPSLDGMPESPSSSSSSSAPNTPLDGAPPPLATSWMFSPPLKSAPSPILPPKSSGGRMSEGYRWTVVPCISGNIGMFNAINSIGDRLQKVFVGECEAEVPKIIQEPIAEELRRYDCVPVFTSTDGAHGHYSSFCKHILWPMFHYIVPNFIKKTNVEDKAWEYYQEVNQKFADVIVEQYCDGDLIWIHDYHLLLVPQMLRKKLPNATIGFFLHIPFPSSEIFRCLHVRNELLDGMLGANMIGFQTYSFARHFLHTCSRLKGVDTTPSSVQLDNIQVYVGIFPIGINVSSLLKKREGKDVSKCIELMKRRYVGKKVLIGREKLDYIKGVPHKLLAFEMFLNEFPEWVGKVVLIQVAMIGAENKELQTQVFDIVSRINGKFGSLEYSPVVYLHQNIPFPQYLALLTIADCCVITSLRDGMNLTSHEYVVCQYEKHSPLILSEFAGTYGSLSGALRVNPWDYREVAHTILEALTMPEDEKSIRHSELLRAVSINTAQFWTEAFVKQMEKTRAMTENIPPLDVGEIILKFRKAEKRLILLGYDGTLTTIKRRPEQASPTFETMMALRKLAEDPKNTVCVLSGRTKRLMDEWLGSIPNLSLSAEYGCFMCNNGEPWMKMLIETDLKWKGEVLEVLEYFTERTEGAEIEHKDYSLTWHYRNAEATFGEWQAKECFNHLTSVVADKYPIIISFGNKAIEIQPIHVSKVTIIKHLLSRSSPPPDLILCIGSDKYDEAMFDYLHNLSQSNPPEPPPSPSPFTSSSPSPSTPSPLLLPSSSPQPFPSSSPSPSTFSSLSSSFSSLSSAPPPPPPPSPSSSSSTPLPPAPSLSLSLSPFAFSTPPFPPSPFISTISVGARSMKAQSSLKSVAMVTRFLMDLTPWKEE